MMQKIRWSYLSRYDLVWLHMLKSSRLMWLHCFGHLYKTMLLRNLLYVLLFILCYHWHLNVLLIFVSIFVQWSNIFWNVLEKFWWSNFCRSSVPFCASLSPIVKKNAFQLKYFSNNSITNYWPIKPHRTHFFHR